MDRLKEYSAFDIGRWDLVGGPLPEVLADVIAKVNEIVDKLNELREE